MSLCSFSGTYDRHGQLVADCHGRPVSVIQDPDTGERVVISEAGQVLSRDLVRVDDRDAPARINGLLADPTPVLTWFFVALLNVTLLLLFAALVKHLVGAEGWTTVTATAYSPHDAIDSAYHATKGADRWRTSTGVNVRVEPYGLAACTTLAGRRVFIPAGQGYLDQTRPDDRWFTIDDTGALVRRRTSSTGQIHLDLRYRTEHSALRFGVRQLIVYIEPRK